MECNKDEAARAKTIAEAKLNEKDFAGAKKFALKAQNLYPGLDGLSQMFTILDVYAAAENKISGEVDWYGVLGVNPADDDEAIRKQYRKLALVLHPDKNKCVGADGAFKLLSEAWTLLSDKSKRLQYNQRRSMKGLNLKIPTQNVRPSTAPPNGYHKFTSRASSRTVNQKDKTVPPPPAPPSLKRTDTFWTICHRCKMHYEYIKRYLNNTLLCPTCRSAFIAKEMAPPSNIPSPMDRSAHQRVAGSNPFDADRRAAAATQNPRTGGLSSAGAKLSKPPMTQWGFQRSSSKDTVAAKAANIIQQANEKFKRDREDSVAAGGPGKRKRDDEGSVFGGRVPYQMAAGSSNGAPPFYGSSGFNAYSKSNRTRELTPLELRNMLMNKAQTEIRKKLTSWRTEKETERARKESKGLKGKKNADDVAKEMVKEESKSQKNKNAMENNTKEKVKEENIGQEGKKGEAEKGIRIEETEKDEESEEGLSMNVPDPDFHDFDLDRTEDSFQDNQVWAAYDNDDGMPRFYALIHKVVKREPFRVKLSWLNSKSTAEFGELDWVGSGFYKTCGEFNVGKYEVNESLNSFSHPVKWTKAPRGRVQICPKKGDVWALYRNWSANWNALTPDEDIHKYDMVKVLDDYNVESGVLVIPLTKVAGFKTVFCPDLDEKKAKQIPNEEMFQFSHQVPCYVLTGEEAVNAPKGCLELDPAATPLELLQVIPVLNGQNIQEDEPAAAKYPSA